MPPTIETTDWDWADWATYLHRREYPSRPAQRELADEIGMSQRSISAYLARTRFPSLQAWEWLYAHEPHLRGDTGLFVRTRLHIMRDLPAYRRSNGRPAKNGSAA